jgi:hypothetical protein
MSVVTEISFLCNNPILQTTTNAQVGRRASGFVQVGLCPFEQGQEAILKGILCYC